MSYEYKELIEQAIIDDDRPLDWEEGFKELDEVYAQAAKADEYEAKAKAFDELQSQLKEGKPYVDGYVGWVSSQSYDGALRKVLELTNKLKDKYEDKLDDGW